MPDCCMSDNEPDLLGHRNRLMLDLKDEFVQCMDYMGLGGKVYNVPGRLAHRSPVVSAKVVSSILDVSSKF